MKLLKTIILVVFTVYFTSCTKEALEETPETTSFQYSWKAEGEDEDLPIPIFGSVQNVQSTPGTGGLCAITSIRRSDLSSLFRCAGSLYARYGEPRNL